jgi:hypothetical protein
VGPGERQGGCGNGWRRAEPPWGSCVLPADPRVGLLLFGQPLGWRAKALWASGTRGTPTVFRPPARGCAARATPGKVVRLVSTPTGLRPGRRGAEPRWGSCVWRVDPRVGLISFGQPWAGGRKPFGLAGSGERQRCFVLQPGVARLALPREGGPIGFNPNGVAARAEGGGTPLGFVRLAGRSQGRPLFIRPTLGWRAKALWASWTKRTPTVFRPSTLGWRAKALWASGIRGTPTVFRPPARGCAARATPGKVVRLVSTPTGLRPGRRGAEPRWGSCVWRADPRVGLFSFGQPWAGGRKPFGLAGPSERQRCFVLQPWAGGRKPFGLAGSGERQRCFVLQPGVARLALPRERWSDWFQPQRGCGQGGGGRNQTPPKSPAPSKKNGVAARAEGGGTPLGFMRLAGRSQGRPPFIRPTLGWRAKALWASWTKRTPTVFRPSTLGWRAKALWAYWIRGTPTVFRPPARGCAALPREGGPIGFNPIGVAARAEEGGTPLGFVRLAGRSQGRPPFIRPTLGWRAKALWASWTKRTPTVFRPSTLGWRAKALWASWTKRTPTVFRPPARGCAARATPGKVVRLVSTPTGLRPGRRGAEPRWGSCVWRADPRVGLLSFGQPWAGGRKPFGLAGPSERQRCFVLQPWAGGRKPFGLIGSGERQRCFVLQPGVARRYPGKVVQLVSTPSGLRPGRRGAEPRWGSCVWRADPRVGLLSFGQPWAGGRKPFGLAGSGERQRCFVLQPGVARLALPRERWSDWFQPQRGCGQGGGGRNPVGVRAFGGPIPG